MIHNNEQWARVCGIETESAPSWPTLPGAAQRLAGARFLEGTFALAAVFLLAMTAWLGALAVRRVRRRGQIRLRGTEVSPPLCARGVF